MSIGVGKRRTGEGKPPPQGTSRKKGGHHLYGRYNTCEFAKREKGVSWGMGKPSKEQTI